MATYVVNKNARLVRVPLVFNAEKEWPWPVLRRRSGPAVGQARKNAEAYLLWAGTLLRRYAAAKHAPMSKLDATTIYVSQQNDNYLYKRLNAYVWFQWGPKWLPSIPNDAVYIDLNHAVMGEQVAILGRGEAHERN